ncbi:MAG: phosphoribosyl-AMP cyclohydrolase [Ktedonobacteraceae bacterium]|nr:phosphoribosyl-AMP cyclohydrolase [Ktedonobacteraceae bacterium]
MVKFDRQGLVPVVIQDVTSKEVLMVAFMNEEALRLTRETGQTHFFSRSRNVIWHKGEQSGNVQEVRDIFINCEENSLLIQVVQHGSAACHDGYGSCYYRRLQPDDSYETVTERIFDPAVVYSRSKESSVSTEPEIPIVKGSITSEMEQKLEAELRQLYGVYLYLRDHDLSEESNTSRLLQERSQGYLVSRLADELQELADVQTGEHVHSGQQLDTILEGSQVGYWLFLIAAGLNVSYNDFVPHVSLLDGYRSQYSDAKAIEQRQECLSLVSEEQSATVAQGLSLGFAQVGWACAAAGINPLAPAEYDLEQMRRKGLVR